ncbi:MAG: DUF1566 domain-containing protein [Methylococcaceae bacterium]|nr:DUF1566 domain-containing protein [Methylococcaceae bacterium]
MKFKHLPLLLLAISSTAEANLIDRGNGMIYDQDLNVTWLADVNYAKTSGYDADGAMDWQTANTWAADLTYGGYSDWRLPTTLTYNNGYNQISQELGHMFYTELGANSMAPIATRHNAANYGLFSNIQDYLYWSGTEYGDPNFAWYFGYPSGGYYPTSKSGQFYYAWAVRDGDVAVVPILPAVWLLGSGLLGLLSWKRRGNIR